MDFNAKAKIPNN